MKDYILHVTVGNKAEGHGSYWYGWSSNLTLTLREAKKLKKKIKNNFYEVEIVKIK